MLWQKQTLNKGLGFKYNLGVRYPPNGQNTNASIGLNLSFDSQNGLDVEPSLSLNAMKGNSSFNVGFELSLNYNSRHGLQSVNFSDHLDINRNKSGKKDDKEKQKEANENAKESQVQEADPKEKAAAAVSNNPKAKLTSVSTRSSNSFASTFNVPELNTKTNTTTVPFTIQLGFKTGVEEWEFKAEKLLSWSGYYTQTKVENGGSSSYNSYGYMYNLDAGTDNTVLRDFQRDNIPYSKKVPNLPMSNFTYDLFSQTGQGSGGMFRSFQNSIAVLNDPDIKSEETSVSASVEFGAETTTPSPSIENLHVGLDAKYGTGYNRSGYWSHIGTAPYQDFPGEFDDVKSTNSFSKPDFENNYFQMMGEKAGFYQGTLDDQLNNLGGDGAIRVKLVKENSDNSFLNRHWKVENLAQASPGSGPSNGNYFTNDESNASYIPLTSSGSHANYYKKAQGRVKRATNVETFTYGQGNLCYANNLAYTYTNHVAGSSNTISLSSNPNNSSLIQKSSQLREMSVLQPDGMRYVYGLPVVNRAQVDDVKSINDANTSYGNIDNTIQSSLNQTTVSSSNISSLSSTADGYESKNEYSPYVNSWLLTYIFSPDYVDRTNNGPTSDDYGYWMKFDYGCGRNV